jgi:hypothetical protein
MKTQNQKLFVASSLPALKMKTSTMSRRFRDHSRSMAIGLGCAVLLFIFARNGQGQFTPANNVVYNVYASDGGDPPTATYNGNQDPDQAGPFGGYPSLDQAEYGEFGHPPDIGVSSEQPIPPGTVTVNTSCGQATSSISFNNLYGNPTGNSVSMTLNNPNTVADELRLDWAGTYNNNSGSTITIAGFVLTVSGSSQDYWQAAAEIQLILDSYGYYTDLTNTYPCNLSPGMCIEGGQNLFDGPPLNSPAGLGGIAGWVGSSCSGSFSDTFTFQPALSLPVANGDSISIWGYIDLIVDPGNVTVQIQPITTTPPAAGIGMYSNMPAIYYPTPLGTNFTVQMTTNLLTGSWVNVSNGIPLSGVIVPNAPSPSFFRVH